MNIIKSQIVTAENDVFWRDATGFVKNMQPAPVLVITTPAAPGTPMRDLLLKMLGACGLTPAHYNIVEMESSDKVAWHSLRHSLAPAVVLLFGITPVQLGIAALFALNAPNRFDGCTWLPSLPLAGLEQQPEMRKQLWQMAMKPVFADKQYGDVLSAKSLL